MFSLGFLSCLGSIALVLAGNVLWEERKYAKEYPGMIARRKSALEKEVAEGRMKTDGKGGYWNV